MIPGHMPPPAGSPIPSWVTWDDVREYARFNRDFLVAVQDAYEAGLSVDDAAEKLSLQERYPDFSMDRARRNVELIYSELSQ